MARRQCPRSPRAEDGFHIFTWLQRKSRAGCFVSWGTRGNLHSGVPTWSFVGVACLRVTRGGVQRLRQRPSRVSPCAAWRLPGNGAHGCWASGGPGSSPGQRWRLQALTRVPAGLLFRASVFVLRGAPAARSVPAVCVHGPPCRRRWAQTCPGTCVQKGLEEELQPTGRLKREVGTQPRSPDQAQWGAGVGQPHSCAPQPQTAQGSAASTPFLLPGAPSPHLPALQRDLSFHLLPVVGRIVSSPNNVLEFQLPGTCKWDLTQTEGLGRGNQVTMRTCQMMVALHPMTGGLVRGT